MKKTTLNLAERQPIAVRAALVALITALVHVALVAGWIDVDQEKAIAAAVDALGGLVIVLWSIVVVTPNAKVITQVTTEGTVVAGDASTVQTGTEVGTVASGIDGLGEPGRVVASAPVKPELLDPAA